jgi:hypothetical protein
MLALSRAARVLTASSLAAKSVSLFSSSPIMSPVALSAMRMITEA